MLASICFFFLSLLYFYDLSKKVHLYNLCGHYANAQDELDTGNK